MNPISRRSALTLLSAGVAGAALSGCGLSSGSAVPLPVRPGSIKPVPQLRGVPLIVGSKEFTEQIILGYIAEFALVAAGARVSDLTNITGSNSARNALISGQVDLMWEYTGTAWISYNGMTEPIKDPIKQYEAVRKLDRERNGIAWTALAIKVNNPYALAVTQQTAKRLNLSKLSDLKRVAEQRPEELTFCLETEFAARNDGFPGVQRTYGFTVDQSRLKMLASGSIYQAVAGGTCNFGEVYETDGRVQVLNLEVLEDDRKFFPLYNLAMTTRVETLNRYPAIGRVLQRVSDRLSNAEMRFLNAQVDVYGKDPADVARNWMVEKGFVTLP